MKNFILYVVAICTAYGIASCSAANNKVFANTAIDATLAACVLENAMLDIPELQTACKFADDLLPVVKQLIAARKTGNAKEAAARAGAPKDAPKAIVDAGKD